MHFILNTKFNKDLFFNKIFLIEKKSFCVFGSNKKGFFSKLNIGVNKVLNNDNDKEKKIRLEKIKILKKDEENRLRKLAKSRNKYKGEDDSFKKDEEFVNVKENKIEENEKEKRKFIQKELNKIISNEYLNEKEKKIFKEFFEDLDRSEKINENYYEIIKENIELFNENLQNERSKIFY